MQPAIVPELMFHTTNSKTPLPESAAGGKGLSAPVETNCIAGTSSAATPWAAVGTGGGLLLDGAGKGSDASEPAATEAPGGEG